MLRESQGFRNAIATYPKIEIVAELYDDDDPEKAVRLAEEALDAYPDIVGIFGVDASNPIGAARAVVNAGKTGEVTVVGWDDLQETLKFIEDGVIAGVIAQHQWEIGYWTVKYLVAMNQKHKTPHEHETGSQMLTKQSLADWWRSGQGSRTQDPTGSEIATCNDVADRALISAECGKETNMKRFEGQTVVVTGGNKGIGYAMAERFAEEGANLVIASIEADVDEAAETLAKATGGEGRTRTLRRDQDRPGDCALR